MSDIDGLGPDPFDTELGARLRATAPESGDADAVLAALRPRLVRARRNRRTGFVAAGAAALALVAGIAFAVTDSAPPGSVEVPPAHHSTVTGPRPTVTTNPPEAAENESTHPETETERTGSGSPTATSADPPTGVVVGSGSGATATATTGVGAGSGAHPATTTTTTARTKSGARPATPPTTDDHETEPGSDDGSDDSDPGGDSDS